MDIEVVSRHEKSRESSPEIARESISTNDYDRSPVILLFCATNLCFLLWYD